MEEGTYNNRNEIHVFHTDREDFNHEESRPNLGEEMVEDKFLVPKSGIYNNVLKMAFEELASGQKRE